MLAHTCILSKFNYAPCFCNDWCGKVKCSVPSLASPKGRGCYWLYLKICWFKSYSPSLLVLLFCGFKLISTSLGESVPFFEREG